MSHRGIAFLVTVLVALAVWVALIFTVDAAVGETDDYRAASQSSVSRSVPHAKFVKAVKQRRAAERQVRSLRRLNASPHSSTSNRAVALAMASALYGWTGADADALIVLWGGESGFNHLVSNHQGSGAYGIPQSLPGSKMASAGPDWRTNPATQIAWGLRYIAKRYGSPSRALAAWRSRSPHWY